MKLNHMYPGQRKALQAMLKMFDGRSKRLLNENEITSFLIVNEDVIAICNENYLLVIEKREK